MASRGLKPEHRSDVMAAARREFGEGNPYGVVAFGIDRKIRQGRRSRARALNVYVVHKHRNPERPLKALHVESAGLRLKPDVIGVGAHPWAHQGPGITPPMFGLYPGAAIHVQSRAPEYGGVACLLGTGGGPTHLLTAGHLFPGGQAQIPVFGALPGAQPTEIGHLQTNLLDGASPIDAALVALTPAGIAMANQSTGALKLTDVLSADAVDGIDVIAFLSTAHDFSTPTQSKDGPVDVQMQSQARGVYAVRQVIGTRAVVTNPGDSGTILFNGQPTSASAVGICVGQFGAMSVFEPLGRALDGLRQGTGLPLQLA